MENPLDFLNQDKPPSKPPPLPDLLRNAKKEGFTVLHYAAGIVIGFILAVILYWLFFVILVNAPRAIGELFSGIAWLVGLLIFLSIPAGLVYLMWRHGNRRF